MVTDSKPDMKSGNTQESIESIKERLGEKNRAIGVYKPSWDFIKKNVFVITLDIKYYRANTKLVEEDLGIEDAFDFSSVETKRCARLGTKRILPAEIMNRISAIGMSARKALETYSYKMPFGSAHLITERGYLEFKKEILPLKSQFYEVRDYLYNNYDDVLDIVREEYRPIAQAAWSAKSGSPAEDAPEAHIQSFVDQIVEGIPSKEEIRDSFFFDWEMDYVNFSLVERSANEAAGLSAVKREIADRIQKTTVDKVESTINIFSKQINDLLYDVATNTLLGVEKSGAKNGFKGRTAEGLKNWIKQVRALNFFDMEEAGQEIDRMISEIESVIGDDKRSGANQVSDLTPILEKVRAFSTEAIVEMTGSCRRTRKEESNPDLILPGEALVRRGAGLFDEVVFEATDTPMARRGGWSEDILNDEVEMEERELARV